MTIDSQGWVDWAIKKPGPLHKTNNLGTNPIWPGPNPNTHLFLHSADGYVNTMWDLLMNGPNSWHFSCTFDGTLYQHYPITAKCWHATKANNFSNSIEFEGYHKVEKSLLPPQIDTAIRWIKEMQSFTGFTPSRTPMGHPLPTLCEHNQVTLIGGSGTLCPAGRIPWDAIMVGLFQPERLFLFGDESFGFERRDKQIIIWHRNVEIDALGDEVGLFPGEHWHHEGDNPDGTPIWKKVLN